MQRDAIERLNLQQLLLEPELLDAVEPDVNLVATLIGLSHLLPEKSRATARSVVARWCGRSSSGSPIEPGRRCTGR